MPDFRIIQGYTKDNSRITKNLGGLRKILYHNRMTFSSMENLKKGPSERPQPTGSKFNELMWPTDMTWNIS